MITQTMVQLSSWIEFGIQIQKVRGLNLFKFTDELQTRLEVLIVQLCCTESNRQKAHTLTTAEISNVKPCKMV